MLVVLPNAYGDAANNMAIDAVLLETIPEAYAALRHYGWAEPSITFGYSQHYEEVAANSPEDVVLCRRATGGGIVDHRNDWTYALVIRKDLHAAQISSTELYRNIHVSIATALRAQGIHSQLAPCPRQCNEAPTKVIGPEQCFIQPVMNDVLATSGAKIAGAAMKRTRKGILVQGSIDKTTLPDDLEYPAFQQAFIAELSESLSLPRYQPEDLRPFFNGQIIEQEKQKFSSSDWTKRR